MRCLLGTRDQNGSSWTITFD